MGQIFSHLGIRYNSEHDNTPAPPPLPVNFTLFSQLERINNLFLSARKRWKEIEQNLSRAFLWYLLGIAGHASLLYLFHYSMFYKFHGNELLINCTFKLFD